MKFLSRSIAAFNRIDARLLVFLVLSVFFLGFRLNFNEEQYFGYAKAFMDKNWMPGSFLFTDFPGTRLLFQYITGFALKFLSFEQLAFFGRMIMFILFAFPVAALARLLRINNVLLVFWLTVLYIPQQNFFGGEWIFGGFESKTVAYLFILWSLYYLLKKDYLKSVLLAAFATWWHFLAAGWYGLYLFVYMAVYLWRSNRKILYYWIAYALIQLPLFIYLFTGLMEHNQTVINGVNTNYVYTYIRNPHHIGIFRSLDYFYHYHFYKVLLALIALILALRIFSRRVTGLAQTMNRFMVIILIQLLVFVPVAYFDKEGTLMKFYPFRGSVIAMLLFQLILIVLFRDQWLPWLRKRLAASPGRKKIYILQLSVLLTITVFALVIKTTGRIEKYEKETPEVRNIDHLASALRNLTNPDDTFLYLCREDRNSLSLPRKSKREAFFYLKYIPTTSEGIYIWYQRYLWQKQLLKDPSLIDEFEQNHEVRYIVSCRDIHNSRLEKVFSYNSFRVYRYVK